MDYDEIFKELTKTTSLTETNTGQINDLKTIVKEMQIENKALYELTSSVKIIAQDLCSIKSEIGGIKKEVSDLSDKVDDVREEPIKNKAKFFDNAKKLILTAIFSGLIMFILGTLAPNVFK